MLSAESIEQNGEVLKNAKNLQRVPTAREKHKKSQSQVLFRFVFNFPEIRDCKLSETLTLEKNL